MADRFQVSSTPMYRLKTWKCSSLKKHHSKLARKSMNLRTRTARKELGSREQRRRSSLTAKELVKTKKLIRAKCRK